MRYLGAPTLLAYMLWINLDGGGRLSEAPNLEQS